jgi:hypothetical protein
VVEKKLCCGIDRQAEEELLQIDSRAILGNMFEHKLEVSLKSLNVGDLIPGEVGPQQVTAVRPSLAIRIEDTVAQKRSEGSRPMYKAEVLEPQTQNGLDVFWFTRRNERLCNYPVMESITEPLEALSVLL